MLTSPHFFSKKNSSFSPSLNFAAVLRAGSRFTRHCAEPLSRSTFSPSSAAGRKTAAAKFSTGFSLVELLVVIGIVTVISATVLVRYGRFSGDVILGSLAYDVALSIRQAQVFGLSFRETGAGTGIFSGGYGIHFDKNTPNDYFLFSDADMNKRYNAPTDAIIENFSVRQGFSVFSLCATLSSGAEKCNPTISSLDISFQRPNPDALIYSDLSADTYKSARIVIRAPEGQTRSISVVSTGQISVPQQ